MGRRRNPLGRFLLEGMDHPNVIAQLQRINDPIGVATLLDRQFPYTEPRPESGLARSASAISYNSQGIKCPIHRPHRKLVEVLLRRLDPRDCTESFTKFRHMLSYLTTKSIHEGGSRCHHHHRSFTVEHLNRFQLMLGSKMGIAQGHGIIAMAEQFAHGVQIDAAHHQP